MIYAPPSSRLDRRRRLYRWHKRNRHPFKRGTLLHADGSVPTLEELIEWKVKMTIGIMSAASREKLFS